jgi:hypothetical protein
MRRLLLLVALVAVLPALAGAQEDALCPTPATAPFLGGPGDDTFEGTPGDDRIDGAGGADTITGLRGADCLTGGDGSDRLTGGFGDDTLLGGPGDDVLDGIVGDDRLDGGDGGDPLRAEGGTIRGGDGADDVSGQELTVDAGAGDDTVRLYRGHNGRLTLGDGDDRAVAPDGFPNTVDCGPGTDTVTVDRRDTAEGCESVTRRAMPDPRLSPRRGGRHTRFSFTFASPLDYDGGGNGSEGLAVEVTGPANRCTGIEYEVRRARRGGSRERVRLAISGPGWCKGRYTAQLWYRTYQITSSCDSGDLSEEDCRGTGNRVGEAVTFRVR